MKRRSLLQGAGFLLGAWGLGATQRVLAAPTTRKLALLIGINQYGNSCLNGCLTDLELQRELLVHRFGFQPGDILTLRDLQATRSRIETAFIEHLIKQAKPGDVVLVHFSGHGALVRLGATAEDVQPCLLTVDDSNATPIRNALPLDTLFLLLKSLPTSLVTTVLDAGYYYPGYSLQGSLRLRSRPYDRQTQLVFDEVQMQERLLQALPLNRSQARAQRKAGQMPGVVIAAANLRQIATESPWNGFQAGLLTYALTQQLWQATPEATLRMSLGRTAELIGKRVAPQHQPELSGQSSRKRPLQPYQMPLLAPAAAGVITAFDESSKTAQLWLGGIPPQVLEHYGSSLLTVESSHSPLLQLVERNGLVAKARLVSADATPLQAGMRVQEAVRVLPRSLGLSIAIASTLDRIERVDAISAFSAMPHVSAVVAGEQVADYVFGRAQRLTQIASTSTDGLSIPGVKYGLFSQGLDALPQTIGEDGEAVKLAVKRLLPQLQILLATKLLGLTVNDGSSQLGVRATLLNDADQVLQQQTDRVAVGDALPSEGKLVAIAPGSRLSYKLENKGNQAIYVLIVGLDNAGNAFVSAPTQPQIIPAGATVTLPVASATVEWLVRDPSGLGQTYLLCSRTPFRQAQTQIAAIDNFSNRAFLAVNSLLELTQAILQDLHQPTEQVWLSSSPDLLALDVHQWTTFRFLYEVG